MSPRDGRLPTMVRTLEDHLRRKALALVLAVCTSAVAAEDDPFANNWVAVGGARLEALDRVTGRISVVEAATGEPVSFGTLGITVESCFRRPPELPPDSAALIDISESRDAAAPPRPLFRGWMFASSPGLSGLEHPVYDVIVLDCVTPAPPEDETEGE